MENRVPAEIVARMRFTFPKVAVTQHAPLFFFFFTLVTGPRRPLSLKLSDTKVYEPHIRARLGNHNTTIIGLHAPLPSGGGGT